MCIYVTSFIHWIPYVDTTSTRKSKMSLNILFSCFNDLQVEHSNIWSVFCIILCSLSFLEPFYKRNYVDLYYYSSYINAACVIFRQNFVSAIKTNYAVILFDVFLHEDFFLVKISMLQYSEKPRYYWCNNL